MLGYTIPMNNSDIMICGFAFDVERVWASDLWRALLKVRRGSLVTVKIDFESVGSFTHVGC